MISDKNLLGLPLERAEEIADQPFKAVLIGEPRENSVRRVVKVQHGDGETVLFVSDFLRLNQ